MTLTENTLFGKTDRIAIAIERLRAFEPEEGYWVGISGGKDSTVINDLVKKSKVKAEYHHSLTTLDAPQTIKHIRKHHLDCTINYPEQPLLKLVVKKGLPTRQRRWCCDLYKERGGAGRFVVTGVRRAEGTKRSNRKMVHRCFKNKSKMYLNPIIDWSVEDVWEYIKKFNLPYNELYDCGFKRVGCIMCPLASAKNVHFEMEFFPKYKNAWYKATVKLFKRIKDSGRKTKFKDHDELWNWWIRNDSKKEYFGNFQNSVQQQKFSIVKVLSEMDCS